MMPSPHPPRAPESRRRWLAALGLIGLAALAAALRLAVARREPLGADELY